MKLLSFVSRPPATAASNSWAASASRPWISAVMPPNDVQKSWVWRSALSFAIVIASSDRRRASSGSDWKNRNIAKTDRAVASIGPRTANPAERASGRPSSR